MSKKLVPAVLAATTILWSLGLAAPLASAQTATGIQAQIAALLAQIQTLQGQLGTSSSATVSAYNYTRDLTVGSKGADVTALQSFLIAQGDLTGVTTPTAYFGALTQKALAKFQAANGISPASGYFGPKTRAFVASMGATTGTGTGTGTGTTPVVTGSPMSISLNAMSPVSGNVAAGAVNTPVLKLNFTAGATPVTVTNLVLHRTGLSQDADLDNVYLYDGATKLASNLGFNQGAITFSNGAGLFTVPANTTKVITVTADVDTNASAGHIFMIGLSAATDVTGGTFTGNFPVNGGQMTVATVSNLGTLTITGAQSSTINVNAGQTNELAGQFTVTAGNQPVKLNSIMFTGVGSAPAGALQNIKLMNGSTQLGATQTLGSSNQVVFDLSGAPLMLTSGQSAVLSLYADVTSGVNRDFQFSIQQSSDVHAQDTTYGVGIGAHWNTPTTLGGFPVYFYKVTINNGGLVITKDASTPTTYVVAGNTNQVLAKFDVLASGDSVKFNELDFAIAGGQTINNFRVVDDQGAQIGTTQNVTGASYAAGSGSLNYIIPANTTRVLTVYGDLPSTATNTVAITLGGGQSSAQSYTTFQSVSVGSVGANSLSVLSAGSNLAASLNYGLGSPVNTPAGAANVKIGSYTFTAGQVNPVNLTGVSILMSSNATAATLRNLRAMYGTTQIGTTNPTVTAGQTYNFNSSAPIAIAANGAITIDIYADVNSSITATTTANMTTLTAINASTQSGNAVSLVGGNIPGQNVTFSNGGVLTGALSAGTPQASYLGMNVTGVTVAQYQFTADTNGNETLTQLNLTDSSSSATSSASSNHSDFINYRLTDTSGNVLGTATENSSGQLAFNIAGLSVPQNTTVYVNLVADTNAYPYAVSGGKHAFAMNSFQYTNASQATTTNVVSNNIGNLFTVYQTTMNVAGASFSAPNSISGVGNTVGEFSFTAGAGSISPTVKSVTLSTAGTLIQASTSQTLGLYDASAPSVLLASTTATSTNNFTFNMTALNANQWQIPYSSTKTLLVKTLGAPSNFVSFSGSNTGSYQVLLQAVTWTDGVTGSITSLSPSIAIPVASQNITGLSN